MLLLAVYPPPSAQISCRGNGLLGAARQPRCDSGPRAAPNRDEVQEMLLKRPDFTEIVTISRLKSLKMGELADLRAGPGREAPLKSAP